MFTLIIIMLIVAVCKIPDVGNEDIMCMVLCLISDILIFKEFGSKNNTNGGGK